MPASYSATFHLTAFAVPQKENCYWNKIRRHEFIAKKREKVLSEGGVWDDRVERYPRLPRNEPSAEVVLQNESLEMSVSESAAAENQDTCATAMEVEESDQGMSVPAVLESGGEVDISEIHAEMAASMKESTERTQMNQVSEQRGRCRVGARGERSPCLPLLAEEGLEEGELSQNEYTIVRLGKAVVVATRETVSESAGKKSKKKRKVRILPSRPSSAVLTL